MSKLCLIPGTDLLVSGGGDDELYVWNWLGGNLLQKYDIRGAVAELLSAADDMKDHGLTPQATGIATDHVESKIAILGLYAAPFINTTGQQETALLVTCERVPALFVIPISRSRLLEKPEITGISLNHPPLDVTCIGGNVLLSLDGREDGRNALVVSKLVQTNDDERGKISLVRDEDTEAKLERLTESTKDVSTDEKALNELLYSMANLRKRRGWVAPGESAAGDDDPDGAEVEDAAI